MKILKEKKGLIIIIFSVILILIGITLIITNNNSNKEDNQNSDETNTNDSDIINKTNVITKSDVMSLIYAEKTNDNSDSDWYVGDTAVLAHNSDDTAFLVRYKQVNNDGKTKEYESVVTITKEKKKIELPGWEIGSKNLDEYNFIYYTPESVGFDPDNQQYSDNSWQNQTWGDQTWENPNWEENTKWEDYKWEDTQEWENYTWKETNDWSNSWQNQSY